MKAYKKRLVVLGSFIVAAAAITTLVSASVLNNNVTTLNYESLRNQEDTGFSTDDRKEKLQSTLMKMDGIVSAEITIHDEMKTAIVNIGLSSKELSLSSEKETKVKDIVADAVGIVSRENVTVLYTASE